MLPLIRPGIIAGSILVFAPCLGAYVTPRVLGGGTANDWKSYWVTIWAGSKLAAGSDIVLTLMVIVLVALLYFVKISNREQA